VDLCIGARRNCTRSSGRRSGDGNSGKEAVIDTHPIVVYCEEGPSSHAAMEWARQEALRWDARVFVVTAIPPLWEWELAALQIDTDRIRAGLIRRLRGAWTQPLRDSGVNYRTEVLRGRPGPKVLELARREDARCIVVPREELNAWRELTSPGVARYVHRHARRPVVEVPAQRALTSA
jgi:nucleotide-binding universal stress UspA family protein